MKKIHLICNAHLDPMWLWTWEEGAAAALSTFRTAVGFCEEYDTFVFCHNEALLYRWIEEYAPDVFERIRVQVARGRWRIMGGWYLQPDCNMPGGEGFVRQIREGHRYFQEKFGVSGFETAVNFDSFGHCRGLVQILNKCGYKYYITARPGKDRRPDLPAFFRWQGYNGSEVFVSKSDMYNSPLGRIKDYIAGELPKRTDEVNVLLWGVGNHGGGPSRKDIEAVNAFLSSDSGFEGVQSDPDTFFREAERLNKNVPVFAEHLGTVFPGVYTSQMRVKQKYRALEAELFSAEKMLSVAQNSKLLPVKESCRLKAAQEDLLFCQFHDVLPGTGIQPVEEAALRKLEHGLEEVRREKSRVYFAMLRQEDAARPGSYPIFVMNPNPYPVRAVVGCEVQLADQNWSETNTYFQVVDGNSEVSSQMEKEESNLNLDWRKRVCFLATLRPMQMNRFDLYPHTREKREYRAQGIGKEFLFSNKYYSLRIGGESGLVESFRFGGKEMLSGPICPIVTRDSEDSWIMRDSQYKAQQEVVGKFVPFVSKEFDGTAEALPLVHVIESGDVRTVLETSLRCDDNVLCVRYILYRDLPYFDMDFEIHWRRKNGCLKVAFDTVPGRPVGETAFGHEDLRPDGSEQVVQRWVAMRGKDANFVVFNRGSYGVSCTDSRICQTLLRSPAYSGHSIGERPILPEDRIVKHMDNGVRKAKLRVQAGTEQLWERLSTLAGLFQEDFFALQAFPGGAVQKKSAPVLQVEDPAVELASFRYQDGKGWIARLFNGSETEKDTAIHIAGQQISLHFAPMEVKNLLLGENGALSFPDELI